MDGLRSTWRRRDPEGMVDDADLMRLTMTQLIDQVSAAAETKGQ
jgi:hypothetical protein